MNTTRKAHFPKTLAAMILALALIFSQALSALAMEPDDPGPVEVSTLADLLTAIEQAEAGDIIGITGEIWADSNTVLGDPNKPVTLQRVDGTGVIYFRSDDGTGMATIQNITFDGAEIPATSPFVGSSNLTTTFNECSFINCTNNGAVSLYSGNITMTDCTFKNNSANTGGHIRISGGVTIRIEGCVFTQGTSTLIGGAIYSDGTCTITGSILTNNHAGTFGGGIWNSGTLTIESTKIYSNTADQGGNDIGKDHWGQLYLEDDHDALIALFAPDGLIPNEWVVDTYVEEDGPDQMTHTFYTMTFADPTPTPDPDPTPDPTPDPEPEPEPTPKPSPRPSGSSGSGSSYTPTTAPTVTPKAVLTCGKAILDPTKTDYLLGYADGLMEQENTVTRAQLAQIIYRLLTADSRAAVQSKTTSFTDVQKGVWYYDAVCSLENTGIIGGNASGKYNPDEQITWGEMIALFYRFVDHKPVCHIITVHWARDAINSAIDFLWIDYTDQFKPDGAVTRSEMVEFIQAVFKWASEQQTKS